MSDLFSDVYTFADYRLDAARRVLTRNGEIVALPPKSFDLLLYLVKHDGRAVPKRELMAALWPETFVEEANLSFQVSALRRALGPDGTTLIGTVPKHGYRFTGPAVTRPSLASQALESLQALQPSEPLPLEDAAASASDSASASASASALPEMPPAIRHTPPRMRTELLVSLIAGVGVIALSIVSIAWVAMHVRRSAMATLMAAPVMTPLTTYPGVQSTPSLSPDGSQVAFAWNGPSEDNDDIYVKLVGPGEPVRLTTDPAHDLEPAWSPDGRHIAFLRSDGGTHAALFIVPALGGAERKLADVELPSVPETAIARLQHRAPGALGWTRDSRWIAVGSRTAPGIALFAADGPERRQLTTVPATLISDQGPTFSPDGGMMAFVRSTNATISDIYIQPLTPDAHASGAPWRLTSQQRTIMGVTWTPDSRAIVLSIGDPLGTSRLERVDVERNAQPGYLPFGESATTISMSRENDRLVYARMTMDGNIWRVNIAQPPAAGVKASAPVRVIASTFSDHTPDYSPDGGQVAFASVRSGTEEIWIANADGSQPRQLTNMEGPQTSNPKWSPDGSLILFNSRKAGSSDVYVIDPRTSAMRRLTTDPADEVDPQWSRDGQWIYYGSNRNGGTYDIWKAPVAGGGQAVQVTKHGGRTARESMDGRWLFYARCAGAPGEIWKRRLEGTGDDAGDEQFVVSGLSSATNFTLGDRGVYFVASRDAAQHASIEYFDLATGRVTELLRLDKPSWFGIALSPDGRSLLFSVEDHASSNLVLVENTALRFYAN